MRPRRSRLGWWGYHLMRLRNRQLTLAHHHLSTHQVWIATEALVTNFVRMCCRCRLCYLPLHLPPVPHVNYHVKDGWQWLYLTESDVGPNALPKELASSQSQYLAERKLTSREPVIGDNSHVYLAVTHKHHWHTWSGGPYVV